MDRVSETTDVTARQSLLVYNLVVRRLWEPIERRFSSTAALPQTPPASESKETPVSLNVAETRHQYNDELDKSGSTDDSSGSNAFSAQSSSDSTLDRAHSIVDETN